MSHTVVLRPLKAGYFNFTSATITYLAQEGGQVVVSGLTLHRILTQIEQQLCLTVFFEVVVRDDAFAYSLILHVLCCKMETGQILFPLCLFQVGFTSAPGQGGILAQREFDRRFSPHFVSIFQLAIELQLPCSARLWRVWFALQSPGKLQHGLQLICISCPEECHRSGEEASSQLPKGAGSVGFGLGAVRVEDLKGPHGYKTQLCVVCFDL